MRLAASLAIDRKTINEAEQLGFAGLTGNIVPRHMEFAFRIDPHPYDPSGLSRVGGRLCRTQTGPGGLAIR